MSERQFNPYDRLEKVSGKPYLNPRNAITWFYAENPRPHGRIITVLLQSEPAIFRAEVYIDAACIATGHASVDSSGQNERSKTLKAVETSAIRRALANAGYGTEQALWWHYQQQNPTPKAMQEKQKRIDTEKDVKQTTPLRPPMVNAPTDTWTHDPAAVTAPVNEAFAAKEAAKLEEARKEIAEMPIPGEPEVVKNLREMNEQFDAVRTGESEQPALGLVDHPKKTRTWDIGKVANYVKFKAKYINVEEDGEAGAEAHFTNLITRLESSLQITDTSSTDEVVKAIDAHYAVKTEAQTKKRKLA